MRALQTFGLADAVGDSRVPLLVLGLASMALSAGSILATRNIKRLVAYASINHAGVIAIGLGLGGEAAYGVLLYAVSNAFIKAILFLSIGHIEAHYQTKQMRDVGGLIKDLPYTGLFLMVGMIYERCHTRELAAYAGLAKLLPVYSVFFRFTLGPLGREEPAAR